MRRPGILKIILYLNIGIIALLVVYKVYLHFFEKDYEAVHADQVERIEKDIDGRSSFKFAVIGNINNSIGIFERKIIPMLNQSGLDFVVSAGNAVINGGEDKYRALHNILESLEIPYLLTYGENENSAFGGFRFYEHYGPYVFSFSAGNSRFVFLDSTGKTSWAWQLRWLEEELETVSGENTFLFIGHPVFPVDKKGIIDFDDDYHLSPEISSQLIAIIEKNKVDVVFSANLPLFSETTIKETRFVITGGAGGLVLNNDRSYYHYVQVAVSGDDVDIDPVRMNIGQHKVFRTLESLWFFVHSLFYVSILNFILLVSILVVVSLWLFKTFLAEKNYYPDFDLPSEPVLDHPVRVAMFTNTFLPFIGGVPISIDRLRRSLGKLGHRVMVVAPHYKAKQGCPDEANILRLPPLFSGKDKDGLVIPNIFLPRIFRAVSDFRPDIVHLHHPYWIGTIGALIARWRKVPMLYTYHTRLETFSHAVPLPKALFRNFISHTLIRRFCNRCDGVIVPTESAEYYLRMVGVKKPIYVNPTPIEYDQFKDVPTARINMLRARFQIDDAPLLVSVSRLSKEKNIDFMIDAVHDLIKKDARPLKLLIVGDGPEREHLNRKIRQLGLEKVVLLAGLVPPEEIPAYYQMGDVFVFASRAETQGMVILEAMASGLPVVAVRSSGIDDFIKNEFNGYKTVLNREVWGSRVLALINDPVLRRRLSENARTFARVYDVKKFGHDISGVYAQVLADRGVKGAWNKP